MTSIQFTINDNTKKSDHTLRQITCKATQDEINRFIDQGYMILENEISVNTIDSFRETLDRIALAEEASENTEHLQGNGHYIRDLLNKDSVFHSLLYLEEPKNISRAVLGPQVWFDAEARIVPAGTAELGVGWHIHHRVIPSPYPPFFSYPHAIHGLLYLDDVDMDTGPICIMPGSHKEHAVQQPRNTFEDKEGQICLPVKSGTILLMHCNLWHKTIKTTAKAKKRRLIIFGYTPSWIKSDIARGVKANTALTDSLKNSSDIEIRELLGEYFW